VTREAFLARLRERLAAPAPPATVHPPGPPPAQVPRVSWAPDDRPLEERFAAALAGVRGRVATLEELPAVLEALDVRTAVVLDERVPLPPGVERLPLERANDADAGFTGARAAAAATGTVVIADEDRMASLLPRVHVVAVPRDALVETPGDLLRDLSHVFPDGLPSMFALATGPSRSADIDGEVVYGVHGPLAVIAVFV
jgi:L-lactate dehydrogenase complex protein LldG